MKLVCAGSVINGAYPIELSDYLFFAGQMIWEGVNRKWFSDVVFCKIFKVIVVILLRLQHTSYVCWL